MVTLASMYHIDYVKVSLMSPTPTFGKVIEENTESSSNNAIDLDRDEVEKGEGEVLAVHLKLFERLEY